MISNLPVASNLLRMFLIGLERAFLSIAHTPKRLKHSSHEFEMPLFANYDPHCWNGCIHLSLCTLRVFDLVAWCIYTSLWYAPNETSGMTWFAVKRHVSADLQPIRACLLLASWLLIASLVAHLDDSLRPELPLLIEECYIGFKDWGNARSLQERPVQQK